jgi:hypothetical protein
MHERDAFVIMPFSSTNTHSEDEWTDIFEHVFKPAFEEIGYSCERAQPMTGSITESIVERLRRSWIVLADLTDKNPNVFYELGIRHSLNKRTIIVASGSEHVPSDLRGYWFITYGLKPGEVARFKAEIKRISEQIEDDPDHIDNAVASYIERENIAITSVMQKSNARRLDALHTELSGNLIVLDSIISGANERFSLESDCIAMLLHERYIDPGPQLLKALYELYQLYHLIGLGIILQAQLAMAREQTFFLMGEIVGIRDALISGTFSDPSALSMMVWEASSSNIDITCCIDVLQKALQGLDSNLVNNPPASTRAALRLLEQEKTNRGMFGMDVKRCHKL